MIDFISKIILVIYIFFSFRTMSAKCGRRYYIISPENKMLNTCLLNFAPSFFFERTERTILQRIFATFEARQYLCSGLGTTKEGSMKGLKKGRTKVVGVHESYPCLPLRKDIINICKHMIKINTMCFML